MNHRIAITAAVLALGTSMPSAAQVSEAPDERVPAEPTPSSAARAPAPSVPAPKIAPPAVIPPKAFVPPQPRQIKLPTGMNVLFAARKGTRLLDVSIVFSNAGAAFEPENKRGATSMAAELLFEGTETKTASELADAIALLGAHMSAGCGVLTCSISAHAPVTKAKEVFALLFEVVARPRFALADLERLKAEQGAAFLAAVDDPNQISQAATRAAMYGAHPLGRDSSGTPAGVAALKVDDVRAAWRNSFRPANATVVIAADANVIDMLKTVVATSKPFKGRAAPPAKTLEPVAGLTGDRRIVVVDKPGAAQSVVSVVGFAPADLKPLTPEVEAFETLFGGSFTSRLNQNLREKHGYAYGAGFSVRQFDDVRPWRIGTSVATKDTGPALGEIAKELARIQTPATDVEVQRAKTYRALTFPQAFATGSDIVGFFAWAQRVGVARSRMAEFANGLLEVDAAALQGAAKRVLGEGATVIVVVGDRAKIESAIAAQNLGTISVLKVSDVMP